MIDLHCHLLPNVDDGPGGWEESLKMVSIAYEDGMSGAVTTPHWIEGTNWRPEPGRIRALVSELNERIGALGIPFTVYPGMEIGMTADLPGLAASGEVLTLAGGRYILVEVPFQAIPYRFEHVVAELKSSGKIPVLAHPERNRELQKKPKRILNIVETGALVQVTASSISGSFGSEARKCSLAFAEMGVIDFVSSDGHSSERRRPLVSEGLAELRRSFGAGIVKTVTENSYKVVENSEI